MTTNAVQRDELTLESGKDTAPNAVDPIVKAHVFQGDKPALKNWRMSASAPNDKNSASTDDSPSPEIFDDVAAPNVHERLPLVTPLWLQIAQTGAVCVTVGWLTYASFYIVSLPEGVSGLLASPLALGGVIASVLAPVALVWVCLATWQRRSDAQIYAEALRAELQNLLFPTPDQARVVNRDIQLLVQQAVELSSSSRAAIKAIQTARQGMRAEVRDFSAVSQKTEFHIDRLTDTLNKRGEELLNLTTQLEERTQSLVSGVDTHGKVWNESVNSMTGKADMVVEKLTQSTNVITDALQKAELQVKSVTSGFAVSGDALASRSRELTQAANIIEDVTAKLDDKLSERLNNISVIKDSLNTGLDTMDAAAEQLLSRAEQMEQKLLAQSLSLKDTVQEFSNRTNDLEKVGESAANKLGEALSLALSGSETIVASVRRAREQMEKAAQETLSQATQYEEQSATRVRSLSAQIDQQVSQLKDLLDAYDSRSATSSQLLEKLSQHNNDALKIADTLDDNVVKATMRLEKAGQDLSHAADRPVEAIRVITTNLSDKISDIADILQIRVNESEQRVSKVQELSDVMALNLQTRVQELASLTGQIIGQTRVVDSNIDAQREKLSGFASDAKDKLEELQSRLSQHTSDLIVQLNSAQDAVQSLGSDFAIKSSATVEQAKQAADNLRATEDEILERLVALAANATQTQFTVQDVAKVLRDVTVEALPLYERATSKAAELEQKFASLDESVRQTAGDVNERMKDIASQIAANLVELDNNTSNAVRNLTGLSEGLKGQTDSILSAADVADEKLRHLQSGLQSRAEDVQLISDQAIIRLESMRKQLDVYIKDLTQNVAAAVAQLNDANNIFTKTSDTLDEKSSVASQKLNDSARQFTEEGHRLSLLAEQAVHKAARIVGAVRDESESMVEKADTSLESLQKASDSFAIRAREIEEYMKSALRSTHQATGEMKSQAMMVAQESGKAVDVIADHISRLATRAEETRQLGHRISQSVEDSREKLAAESDRLAQVTRKAAQSSEDTAQSFVRHGALILKAADDIAQQADRLKENQTRNQREAFLSSVKFVVESLHSLAVDVARHLESEVDDKSWKSFQKGDVAAFTRRLVEVAPNIPLDRARLKFEQDSEFRNYTQRYLRQFEDMVDQARTQDHGDLLVGTFATSDMAKLYRILCDISGRTARI